MNPKLYFNVPVLILQILSLFEMILSTRSAIARGITTFSHIRAPEQFQNSSGQRLEDSGGLEFVRTPTPANQ